MTSLEVRRILIHGHEVAYRAAGEGPVLVLIHGMVGSSATWNRVIPELARSFTVIAPDLLGHGDSAKPEGDYSLGAYACQIRDLMVALGHERATLVGQSFGGGVAMQLAYQHPERCERLVLVGSGGLGREVNLVLRALAAPGAELLLPLGCTRLLRRAGAFMKRWLGKVGLRLGPALDEIGRSYAALTDAADRRAFMHTLRGVIDLAGQRVSAHDRLYLSAAVPTLLIWGDSDQVIPVEHAIAAHKAIPGSRLEVFGGVGHFPHCEAPERFVEVLCDFMRAAPAPPVSDERWRELLLSPARAAA